MLIGQKYFFKSQWQINKKLVDNSVRTNMKRSTKYAAIFSTASTHKASLSIEVTVSTQNIFARWFRQQERAESKSKANSLERMYRNQCRLSSSELLEVRRSRLCLRTLDFGGAENFFFLRAVSHQLYGTPKP